MMRKRLIVITGILVALSIAGFFYKKYRIAPAIELEKLQLTDLEGNKVNLRSFEGNNLFLNFFATWCGPCMRELPSLVQTQASLDRDNFRFILISDEPVERLKALQQSEDFPLLILHSEIQLREYSIFTIPTSYLVNAKGEVVFKMVGDKKWNSAELVNEMKKAF